MQRIPIGSIHTTPTDFRGAVSTVLSLLEERQPALVVTPNIAHVWQAETFNVVREAYRRSDFSPPDGWPVVRAIRILASEGTIVERVSGADLMLALCKLPLSVNLVGGQGDSASRAAEKLKAQNSDLVVVGAELAPSDELADTERRQDLIRRIAESGADIVFLGLGVPKQEALAIDLLKVLDRGVVMCVGAAIEFAAGSLNRAPVWMQKAGLEWLYRVIVEPRKLAVRYAKSAPFFVKTVFREKLMKKNQTSIDQEWVSQ